MTLRIDLSPEFEAILHQRAAATGKDMATLAREALEEKLRVPSSFAELLAPIHETTRKSGDSQDQLAELIEDCREEAFVDRQGRRRS
jgi:predicted DNA-binding protein